VAELVVDHASLRTAGSGIQTCAQSLPGSGWVATSDPGSHQVAVTIEHAAALVSRQVLGAAAEMFRVGQRVLDASAEYAAVDRALRATR